MSIGVVLVPIDPKKEEFVEHILYIGMMTGENR